MPLKRIQLLGFLSHSVLNDFLDQDQPRKKKKAQASHGHFHGVIIAVRISVLHRWFNNNNRMGHSSLEREETLELNYLNSTSLDPIPLLKHNNSLQVMIKSSGKCMLFCHFISQRNIKK